MHFLLLSLLIFYAFPVQAYVGPGPGLSMIGSFFTLIGGIFFALFMVIFYPLRLLWKKRKRNNDA
jgi:hypothetical protein